MELYIYIHINSYIFLFKSLQFYKAKSSNLFDPIIFVVNPNRTMLVYLLFIVGSNLVSFIKIKGFIGKKPNLKILFGFLNLI